MKRFKLIAAAALFGAAILICGILLLCFSKQVDRALVLRILGIVLPSLILAVTLVCSASFWAKNVFDLTLSGRNQTLLFIATALLSVLVASSSLSLTAKLILFFAVLACTSIPLIFIRLMKR